MPYTLEIVFITFALVALYLLPANIAYARKHRNTWAIFALNLFLGWTLIGWVAALVWGLLYQPKSDDSLHRDGAIPNA